MKKLECVCWSCEGLGVVIELGRAENGSIVISKAPCKRCKGKGR